METKPKIEMLSFIKDALRRGLRVHPLVPRTKTPLGGTHSFYSSVGLENLQQIFDWWAAEPEANIGIDCGGSNITVVDIDYGFADEAAFRSWFAASGLPPTLTVRTGRRTSFAVQLYYRGASRSTGAKEWALNGAIGEIKSTGGIVLYPGSVHQTSGERYEILDDLPIADLTDAVLAPVKQGAAKKVTTSKAVGKMKAGEGRNMTLTSLAGTLRNKGVDDVDAMFAQLKAYNDTMFEEPLDDAEVMTVANSAINNMEANVPVIVSTDEIPEDTPAVESEEKGTPLISFPLTDTGNAERFAYRYGDKYKFTQATGWMAYEHGVWLRDKVSDAEDDMLKTIRLIMDEAAGLSEEAAEAYIGFAKGSESAKGRSNAINMAKLCPVFARDYADFNKHPELLNVRNGTLNLETGEFLKHDPDHLLTKQAPIDYDPAAACPKFEKFVGEVMQGNKNLMLYIQRCAGYTLTAKTGECSAFFITGGAGGGKSTYLNLMAKVLGEYAIVADSEMLMAKKGDSGQPFEMAGSEGVRLIASIETETDKKLALAKFKRMTGGDRIRAVYKHKDWFEFEPQYKLYLACNEMPQIDATDQAAWDRVKPIPFNARFRGEASEIQDLKEILFREEASGILNWYLRGLTEWKKVGLAEPEDARKVAKELRESEDFFKRFLEDRTTKTEDNSKMVKCSDLFGAYQRWSDANNEGQGWSAKRFTKEMKVRGYESKVVKQLGKAERVWVGLAEANAWTPSVTIDLAVDETL